MQGNIGPAARARRADDAAAPPRAIAQNPFGAPRRRRPAACRRGIAGWLLAKQAEFYRMLSGTIRSAKTDGSAVWLLMGISFAYGVFHAAGPGHGKAVISSYLVANEETWKRGIMLSFLSAFLQAMVAVALVGIAAALLGATAGSDEPRGMVDRDRKLHTDRRHGRAAVVGEGQGVPARTCGAARAEERRRRCHASS